MAYVDAIGVYNAKYPGEISLSGNMVGPSLVARVDGWCRVSRGRSPFKDGQAFRPDVPYPFAKERAE